MQIPNSPVTVLFADVVGSTRIYDQIGDEAASTLIGGVLRQVTEVASQAGGRHMKNIGDCVMLQFTGTPAAFLAAKGIIAAVNRHDSMAQVNFRVGLQVGTVVRDDDDFFGDTVNVAAHITKLATPGGIVLSDAVYELLPPSLRAEVRPLGRITLKGRQEPIQLYEALGEGALEATSTMYAVDDDVVENQNARLCLEVGGDERYLLPSDSWLTLGRAKVSDIVLASSEVSRAHARIGWHDGNFVLVDQSANGTFVRIVGQETHIRRQEMLLFGSGEICCGARCEKPDTEIIRFRIET
jgi:adenylate cyclase